MTPIETTRMSTRGQVIIPKAIRKALDLQKDDLFVIKAMKDSVILKRLDREQLLEDFRKIQASIDKDMTMAEINAEIKAARRNRHQRHHISTALPRGASEKHSA